MLGSSVSDPNRTSWANVHSGPLEPKPGGQERSLGNSGTTMTSRHSTPGASGRKIDGTEPRLCGGSCASGFG